MKRFAHPGRYFAAATISVLLVAACSSTGSSAPATTSAAPSVAAPSVVAAKKKIGVVVNSSSVQFDRTVAQGIKDAAAAAGWDYVEADGDGSVEKDNAAIENFVTSKVDAIGIITVASTSLASGLAKAKAAGIPVVTQDGGLADGIVGALANVNEESAGAVIDQMIKDMSGKGQLLALTYDPGAPCKIRDDLLLSKLKANPGITLTRFELPESGHPQAAQTATNAWLTQHPASAGETMAIWACYDDPAVAGTTAAVAQGRTGVLGYGYNGGPPTLQAMQKGQFTATEWFDPTAIGTATFKVLQDALAAGPSASPAVVPGPYLLITKDTLVDFLKTHPDAIKG
jgi:ribose transport system substrate-binding protein